MKDDEEHESLDWIRIRKAAKAFSDKFNGLIKSGI